VTEARPRIEPESDHPATVETRADTRSRTPARDRLVAAANELFYAEGIQTVGVDRVIERAGVSRASFYNNFDSKEQLIHIYLVGRHDGTTARLSKAIAEFDDPFQKILAVFDTQAEQLRQPDFNGCAFVAASTEAAPGSIIQTDATEFRAWIRAMFTDLAAQAGAANPSRLGQQLHVIYDGAGLTARMDHSPDLAADTRAVVETLLDNVH
jgi:AcrR family transcriptional regulator